MSNYSNQGSYKSKSTRGDLFSIAANLVIINYLMIWRPLGVSLQFGFIISSGYNLETDYIYGQMGQISVGGVLPCALASSFFVFWAEKNMHIKQSINGTPLTTLQSLKSETAFAVRFWVCFFFSIIKQLKWKVKIIMWQQGKQIRISLFSGRSLEDDVCLYLSLSSLSFSRTVIYEMRPLLTCRQTHEASFSTGSFVTSEHSLTHAGRLPVICQSQM